MSAKDADYWQRKVDGLNAQNELSCNITRQAEQKETGLATFVIVGVVLLGLGFPNHQPAPADALRG